MAYLDPGTTNFIIQLILGGLVGIVVVVKIFWSKIVGIFKGKEKPAEEDINSSEEETELNK
jgi:hypothetical protein